MLEFISKLFETGDFPSQWHCGSWSAAHGWLHIVSDMATFVACLSICGVLGFVLVRRRAVPFPRVVGLFCAFVAAFAAIHLMAALVFWWPAYRLFGVLKAGTAIVSWITLAALIAVVPRALRLGGGKALKAGIRRRNEAEQSLCKLTCVVETLEDPIICTTLDGAIASWNNGAERILQYSAAEAIGQNVSLLFSGDGVEETRRWLGEIESERWIEPFETVLRGKHGERFDASLAVSAVRDGNGKAMGASMIVRDITQRKQDQQAVQQKEQRLRESQKLEAVGALAGGVAHEFNNLLQAIQGYTKYAMEGLAIDERRYLDLQQVLDASDRAALLVRQLLNFGRRNKIERIEFDVNGLVSDMEMMLRPLIGEHIELRIDLYPQTVLVEGDAGLLQQTVMNLCINARDAMPEGGRLCIRTEKVVLNEAYCRAHVGITPGRYAVLTVADTGQGISKEVSGHIFEPFFTTKGVGKGTGLGLAMVYGVVQQHGGVIHVYSEPEQGATFKIYLPAVGVEQMAREPAAEAAEHRGRETVLVAEDEPMVRDLEARILRGAGYTVLLASDGEEAQRLFEAHCDAISLALLDVVMPKRSGRTVYEEIKRLKPETKVVFCTGYDPETGQADFASDEGLRLMQKPVDPDVLLRTIREVLDDDEPCHMLQATR
jgi:two-component system cell cycle sensor histidine kinase/response regulator CckA